MALSGPTIQTPQEDTKYILADEDVATPTTTGSTTSVYDAVKDPYDGLSMFIENTSDRSLTVTLQASPDSTFDKPETLATATLAAGDVTPTTNVFVLTNRHAYLRVKAVAAASNSTVGKLISKLRAFRKVK